MNQQAKDEVLGVLEAALGDLQLSLEQATADDMEVYGAYVITTSPGCYYKVGAQGARGIRWASRFKTRVSAGLTARDVVDGLGNKGEVKYYRTALHEEIDRLQESLLEIRVAV